MQCDLLDHVTHLFQVTGKYSGGGHDAFLPFTARFYVTAGATALKLVHFFIYDGDQTKDFIKGLVNVLNDIMLYAHSDFL